MDRILPAKTVRFFSNKVKHSTSTFMDQLGSAVRDASKELHASLQRVGTSLFLEY